MSALLSLSSFVPFALLAQTHRELAEGLKLPWTATRLPLLDVFHAFSVAFEYRCTASRRASTFQLLCAYILNSLGGTTCVGLLLGQPPSWLLHNYVLPIYIIVFLLIYWCPGDVLFRVLRTPAMQLLVQLFDDISWSSCITLWGVNKALHADHTPARQSVPLALLCGVLAGCGGGIISAMFSLKRHKWQFNTPPAIAVMSYGIKMSLICSVFYYLSHDPHELYRSFSNRLLSADDGVMVVVLWVSCVQILRNFVLPQAFFDQNHALNSMLLGSGFGWSNVNIVRLDRVGAPIEHDSDSDNNAQSINTSTKRKARKSTAIGSSKKAKRGKDSSRKGVRKRRKSTTK